MLKGKDLQCYTHTFNYTRLTTLCPGLPGWASTRKVKPIWILLKQETVSGSGIRWAICKSAPRSRQRTTPAPHHSVFYRPDALPAAQPTASKHWRHEELQCYSNKIKSDGFLKCPHNHWLTRKAYLCHNTVADISKSFAYNMAAKTSWHRYKTNLRHCHPMYITRC